MQSGELVSMSVDRENIIYSIPIDREKRIAMNLLKNSPFYIVLMQLLTGMKVLGATIKLILL